MHKIREGKMKQGWNPRLGPRWERKRQSAKASGGAVHEGRDERVRRSNGKGNAEVARPIEGVWDRETDAGGERAEWAFRGPREVKSPEDGPRPPRAVIQEGRVDETKETRQGGGGAEKAGEKGGGCRGMRPWSRYIRAPVPAYARVFVYLCGTPENSADVREIERKRQRERKKSERATSPVKGKDEDRRKSQWPAKVCCPFVTRERVGRYTRERIRLCSKNTRKQTTATPPSSPPHCHAAHRAFLSPSSLSFSFSRAAPVTLVSPLFLSLFRSALFLEIPSRSTASLRLLPFGSLGDTARSKQAIYCRNFCTSSRPCL